MIDKLLNVLLWISEITTRTRDHELNEYREYQRRILGWGVLAIVFLGIALFIQPNEQTFRPAFVVVAELVNRFSIGFAIASLISIFAAAWNGIGLYRFLYGRGE